jgi:hypothetical protein
MVKKIMLIGYGSAGKYIIDMAARLPELRDCEFTIVSRTPKAEAEKRINLTLVSGGIFGCYPKVNYIECDIDHTDKLSEIIARVSPKIIVYTGRYMKGFKYGEFSYPNEIGYGVWTPMAVVLIEKVMRAVKNAGVNTRVINTSYGDAVSPLLATVGLAPYTSAGNLNHLIPRIARAYAGKTGADPHDVDITFVGSHYANTYISKEGTPKGSPFLLAINGKTVTDALELFKLSAVPAASGAERNIMIASDAVMLIRLMTDMSETVYKIHAPGPAGLTGGYPLTFKSGEMNVDETVFTLDEMKRVNADSLRCDGVDSIDANGITFTDESIAKMKSVFAIEYPKTLAVEDCEAFSVKIAKALTK